jgi:uncharacterized membrane protein YesL
VYSIYLVQHTLSTAYTEYSIHQVLHTPNTTYTKYSIHTRLVVFPLISYWQVDTSQYLQLSACFPTWSTAKSQITMRDQR